MKLNDKAGFATALALVMGAAETRDTEWVDLTARERYQDATAVLLNTPLNPDSPDLQANAVVLIALVAELAGAAVLQLRTNIPGFDVQTWLQQFDTIPKEG